MIMNTDEGVTFWVMMWGDLRAADYQGISQEQYDWLRWFGEQIGWGKETEYPTVSYTWDRLYKRHLEMRDELANNRQRETQVSSNPISPRASGIGARTRAGASYCRQVLGGAAHEGHDKARS